MAAAVKDDADEQPSKPGSYDEAYPGRFLKAGNLGGKTIVFRIVEVERRTLTGVDGKKRQTTITLEASGREFQIVAPKINGFCLRAMFGDKIEEWIGKRVALFATNKFAPMNGEECLRVWGSPDIKEDFDVDYLMPRRSKPVRMTMHAMGGKAGRGAAPSGEQTKLADPNDDGRSP